MNALAPAVEDRRSVAIADAPPADAPENDGAAAMVAACEAAARAPAGDPIMASVALELLRRLAAQGWVLVRLEDDPRHRMLAVRYAVHRDTLNRLHVAEAELDAARAELAQARAELAQCRAFIAGTPA